MKRLWRALALSGRNQSAQPKRKAGRMSGTRARGPAPEPRRVGYHLAVVASVLLLLGAVAVAPHAYDRGRVAVRDAPFLLSAVKVRGLDRLTSAELGAVLGIEAGAPLLDVDSEALATRLEGHAWVADAVVVRQPPDRLRIQIREHVPLAVTPAGSPVRPHVVNEDGTAFAAASPEDVRRLVAVALDPPPTVDEPDERLVEALRLAASLRERGLEVPRQLRLGLPQREQSAELRLRGFAPAVWIERTGHGEQLDRLATLLTSNLPAAHAAEVIDLRFAKRAVLWSGP